MQLNKISKLLLVLAISSCKAGGDPQPGGSGGPTTTPIAVQVSEGGAPSYSLRDAYVVNSNYQTGAASLTVAGKLNSGKLLTLTFTRSGTAAVNTTNQLEATLDSETGTTSTGTTTYNSTARTVDGTFSTSFAAPGVVSGTFSKVPL